MIGAYITSYSMPSTSSYLPHTCASRPNLPYAVLRIQRFRRPYKEAYKDSRTQSSMHTSTILYTITPVSMGDIPGPGRRGDGGAHNMCPPRKIVDLPSKNTHIAAPPTAHVRCMHTKLSHFILHTAAHLSASFEWLICNIARNQHQRFKIWS